MAQEESSIHISGISHHAPQKDFYLKIGLTLTVTSQTVFESSLR